MNTQIGQKKDIIFNLLKNLEHDREQKNLRGKAKLFARYFYYIKIIK